MFATGGGGGGQGHYSRHELCRAPAPGGIGILIPPLSPPPLIFHTPAISRFDAFSISAASCRLLQRQEALAQRKGVKCKIVNKE